jgi:hypothetical protein
LTPTTTATIVKQIGAARSIAARIMPFAEFRESVKNAVEDAFGPLSNCAAAGRAEQSNRPKDKERRESIRPPKERKEEDKKPGRDRKTNAEQERQNDYKETETNKNSIF